MEERNKKLLRYIELAARDSRNACGQECQREMELILAELACSHDEAIQSGKKLMEELS
ncbi:MAG: hypothetical protein UY03_C0011G0025 [Parcubacteria group bacterium GW2011_GWA2_47_64]|nr:MAG: hypothetical protein UY03_C0011G0025 [Parcubacteria group bacterium GW2011_GWA2_47_64]KKU96976.1 MAG: hypothetical protein UY29_C0004G0030 [Parcubacteria group bacterium GW2011_GWC2_48_17]